MSKQKRIDKIVERYGDKIKNINDLTGGKEPSKLFYILAGHLDYLLDNDPDVCIKRYGVKIRKAINPIVKKLAPLFMKNKQVFEDREKLILCLSSCEGAGASSIGDKWPIKMYRHLIAPIRDIFWYEAAVAYTNFYYAIRIPKLSIGDAVQWMNQSLFDFTGNPTFIHYDGQLQNLIKHAPNPLIKAMHIAHKDELSKFTSIYNN